MNSESTQFFHKFIFACLFVTERHYTLLHVGKLWRTTALIYVNNQQYYTLSRQSPQIFRETCLKQAIS